jgi:hypothetical protein
MVRRPVERWGALAAVACAAAVLIPAAEAHARSWGQPVPVGQGSSAAVATDALGDAVVGYTDGSTVQVRTRSASGALGPPVTIGQAGPQEELRFLHIAMDADGNAVAAWIDVPSQPPFRAVAAIRPAGGAFGPARVVADDVHGRDNFNLAIARGGWAALTWDHGFSPDFTEASIRAPGGDFGAPERVSPDERTIDAPRIAVDAQGGAVATWDNFGSGGEMAARPPGGPWGAVEQVGSGSTSPEWPGVAIDGQGNALTAYSAGGSSIRARYRPAGGAFGSPEQVSQPPDRQATSVGGFLPSPIGFDSSGTATVLWNDSSSRQLFASTRPAGGSFGSPSPVSRDASDGAQLAVSADGSAFALWTASSTATGPSPLTGAVRAASGDFGAPRPMAGAANDFAVAADATGDGFAAWTESSPSCGQVVALAVFSDTPTTRDATPPSCTVPPPDTTPPTVSLAGPKRQRALARHRVVVSLQCTEDCQAKVSGSLKAHGARRPLSLKPVARKLRAGRRATLALALPARVAKALAGLRPGRTMPLVVTASATDAAGNAASVHRTISLTR